MPPKTKYSRDDVIQAATEVVDNHGLDSLTARSVAARLGSSTAPVYSHFATMDELALGVMKKTTEELLAYTTRPYTDRVFLNMGTGVAMFACEHRGLYRALLLEGNGYGEVVSGFLDTLLTNMKKDSRFTALSDAERHRLLTKMWIFTHGLASLICVGLVKDCSQDYIIRALTDIGADVIGATLARQNNDRMYGQ